MNTPHIHRDTIIAWFNQGQFGLSTGLRASASLKYLRGRIQQELFK